MRTNYDKIDTVIFKFRLLFRIKWLAVVLQRFKNRVLPIGRSNKLPGQNKIIWRDPLPLPTHQVSDLNDDALRKNCIFNGIFFYCGTQHKG